MKKQILFLAMFTMALIFAGTTNSYGQLLPRTTPAAIDTISCITNSLPLHPVPGVNYTYKMDGETGEEWTSNWTWWATKDTSFINGSGLNTTNAYTTGAGDLLNASAHYLTSTLNADSVVIAWSPEVLALTKYQDPFDPTGLVPSPTFVVAYAEGINCADNIEVYEINPIPAFVVDIANITEDGVVLDWGVDTAQCVDIIRSAHYNDGTNTLMMDYGTDTLFFEVVASNFVTSWTPYFQIMAGLTDSQVADIGIATTLTNARAGTWITGTSEVTDLATGDSTSFGGVELTALTASEIPNGVSVIVRVVIHNNTYESLISQTFTLAVDGRDLTDQWDLKEDDCSDPTAASYDNIDEANQFIRPRPTIDGDPANFPNTTDDSGEIVTPETIIDKERN